MRRGTGYFLSRRGHSLWVRNTLPRFMFCFIYIPVQFYRFDKARDERHLSLTTRTPAQDTLGADFQVYLIEDYKLVSLLLHERRTLV